jgi:DNA replicative helicase MCM subunit Mcm2 (Cdc46/Mcm family)
VGIIGDFIGEAIFSKIQKLSPRNYSTFAHSQYLKNPNFTPEDIRIKLKNRINTVAKTKDIFSFLVDSIVSAV